MAMELPLYEKFTDGQVKQFGPVQRREVISATERYVYSSPFMYDNLEVGDFYEIDPTKGIEFKADDGYITITEELPIVSVMVVGSGCTPGGYNICEWWAEGETLENANDQLVKRQRIDHLNGIHPSIWIRMMMGTAPCTTFRDVSGGDIRNVGEALKKLSNNFYGNVEMGLYENTAHFRVGPPYPNRVTIRCGCKGTEDPGTSIERYPADYAIRLVEVTVIKPA